MAKKNVEDVICATFLDMAEKTSVFKIKVKDLCEQAEVNRNSFYVNFDSIYAVLQKIEDDFFDGLAEESSLAHPQKITRTYLQKTIMASVLVSRYLDKNEKVCRILLGENGDMAFQIRLMNYVRTGIEKAANEAGLFESAVERELAKEFLATGLVGVIKERALRGGEIDINEWTYSVSKFIKSVLAG